MGIPGLISVIGPGERMSLSAFAVSFLQEKKRPVRIAIDISIWLFQVQASKGGLNPELRTLLFRLLRLASLPVHPLFVYDGQHKPHFKRGKVVRGNRGRFLERQSQRLLAAFNLPWHRAPGEAEAECSKLQRAGIVDAVMTEDIDAVMFGSEVTIMNFTKEGGGGAATHVSIYRTKKTQDGELPNVSMDRDGMILFALLSGGDYIPAGIPKCGTKLAAEIVAAGFAKELLAIFKKDGSALDSALADWRQKLEQELQSNTSGFFKTKHKVIQIPDTFPDRRTLLDYLVPVTSSIADLTTLRRVLRWDQAIDAEKVKDFVQKELGWNPTSGAVTLTKILSPALLAQRMLLQLPLYAVFDGDEDTNQPIVCNEKTSENAGYGELRVEFLPAKVVGFDIDEKALAEATNDLDDLGGGEDAEATLDSGETAPHSTATLQSRKSSYDRKERKRIWVPEPLAEFGMAEIIRAYRNKQEAKRDAQRKAAEEKVRRNEARAAAAAAKKNGKRVVDPSMKEGSILKYTRVVKSSSSAPPKPLSPKKVDVASASVGNRAGSAGPQSDFFTSTKMAEQAQVSRTERSKQLSSSHSQPVNTASGDYSTAELEACFDPDYNYEGLRDELEQRTKSIRKTTRKGPSSVQRLEKAWSVHRSYKAAAKMQAERSQSASPVAKHIVSEAVDKETDEHAISVQSSCEGSASAGPGSQDLNSHDDNTENFSVRTACKESQSTDQIRTKKATRTNPSQKANASILDSFPVSKPNTSTAKQSLSKKKDAKGGNSPMVSLLSDSEDCQDVAASSTRTKPSNEVLTLPVRTKQPAKDREDPARPLDFPSEIKTIRLQDFVFGKKRYPMFRIPYAAIGTCGGYWRFRSERSKGKGVSNSGEKADDYDHDQEFNEKKIWRGPVDYIDMTGD